MTLQYLVVNYDKKQFFHLSSSSLETHLIKNKETNFLINLIAGDWKGERVSVITNTAEAKGSNVLNYDSMFFRFIELELGIIWTDEDGDICHLSTKVFDHVLENFTEITVEDTVIDEELYIYNPAKNCYIDMQKTPTLESNLMVFDEDKMVDVEKVIMNPIVAFLLVGWRNEEPVIDANSMHNRTWISESSRIEVFTSLNEQLNRESVHAVELDFINMGESQENLFGFYTTRIEALVEQNESIKDYGIGSDLKSDLDKSMQTYLMG